MMRRWLAAGVGAALALVTAVALLAFLIDGAGGSRGLMLQLMRKHAPAEVTGLPQEHYPAMAEMITDYLAGRTEEFRFAFTDAQGVGYQCFNAREQQHMADVKALFDLARGVLLGAFALGVLLAAAAYALRARRRYTARGFLWGVGAVLAALLALFVWGAADFDGLFVMFHRLSFSNDLWLLDPRTELLIRLMPTSFFIHYAALLGGTWLAALLCMAALARHLSTRWKQ